MEAVPRGKEVAGRVLVAMTGTLTASGHPPPKLLAGLPFGLDDLRKPSFRVDWPDFMTFWGRVDDALGGEAGVEQMAVDIVESSFAFRVLSRTFLTPRQFYLGFVPRMGRAFYTNIRSTMVALDDDRVVWESKVAPGYTFPRSFGAATRGLLRAYTRLLDLPEARVEGTSDGVLMRYVIALPPPRTLASAWKRLAAPILAAPHDLRADFDVAGPEEIDDLLLSRPTPSEHVHELGAGLTAAPSLEALGAAVLGLLEHHFLVHTAALWCATRNGTLAPVGATRADRCDSLHTRDLVVGGRHVGRLDVDGAVLHPLGASYDEFEALLPWISMALARLLESPPDGESALREAAQAARLTRRETEVLRWEREGRTDREIGTILDISPRTVQKHVERILTKMGAETRFAAARRTFEMR